MKTFFFLSTSFLLGLYILLFSGHSYGQNQSWSAPVALTDSLTDNVNPVFRWLYFPDAREYVFWEKSADENTSAIYYQDFYEENAEPHLFMEAEGVHYRNPQPVDTKTYQSEDTLFYIFYESDEEGYNNIYYRVYNASGFTESQPLSTSTAEKTNLICNLSGRIIWMEQNRIMHIKLNPNTHIFDDPVVIDSGNCSSPSIIMALMESDQPMVAWIKEVNDSSRVMVRQYNTQDGWMEPEVIFTAPQCLNLSFCSGFGSPEILTWDYYDGTTWRIYYYDMMDGQTYLSAFDASQPFYPFFYSGYIPVSRWFEAGFTSLIYTENGISGVYNSPYFFGVPFENYQNVSGPADSVRNTQIFTGKMVGCNQYIINIWQQQVNDHWQLKYSETSVCLSGVDKNKSYDPVLSLWPNPCSKETMISFSLNSPGETLLTIRNMSGKPVATIVSGKLNTGKHEYQWNTGSHTSGLYTVTLQTNSKVITKKLILLK